MRFEITKAVLRGAWGPDGKVKFESSYTGNYDEVVEYVYMQNGVPVKASDLKEGEKYTAVVRLKDTDNFELAEDFSYTCDITYMDAKSGMPWWLILLMVLAAILLIVIIIIIIIVIKRRAQTEYEYEDYYEDGYDDEEETEDEAEAEDEVEVSGDGELSDGSGEDEYAPAGEDSGINSDFGDIDDL